jgi:hypothetical protein
LFKIQSSEVNPNFPGEKLQMPITEEVLFKPGLRLAKEILVSDKSGFTFSTMSKHSCPKGNGKWPVTRPKEDDTVHSGHSAFAGFGETFP